LGYTSTSSSDSSVLTGVNKRLELGRLVEEDVSLEPVRDGVLDLVGGELAGRDLEDKVHFLRVGTGGQLRSCRTIKELCSPRESIPWSQEPRR
jgi:hypothetical protein